MLLPKQGPHVTLQHWVKREIYACYKEPWLKSLSKEHIYGHFMQLFIIKSCPYPKEGGDEWGHEVALMHCAGKPACIYSYLLQFNSEEVAETWNTNIIFLRSFFESNYVIL
jgi:hypothetical protein